MVHLILIFAFLDREVNHKINFMVYVNHENFRKKMQNVTLIYLFSKRKQTIKLGKCLRQWIK
jgi:hypothetical protein